MAVDRRIEDYGFIGNTFSAALIGRDGTMEWLCLPRFDSPALFAAMLGTDENGSWRLAPCDKRAVVSRRYRPGTAILETRFQTETGSVTIIDFMPVPDDETGIHVVRLVRGEEGSVEMATEIRFRFDYGHIIPWLQRWEGCLIAVAGPDAVRLTTPVALENKDFATTGSFTVAAGETVPFVLTWYPSHHRPHEPHDPGPLLEDAEARWRHWIGQSRYEGPWREAVERSLITLKALTYRPTGGIVAAATTSLPERIGGPRNWDYRYCWIRDATFTLYALLTSGYPEEAARWRAWLMRATGGAPAELQIMYGLMGDRRLAEYELEWLPGFANSRPVRIGNLAHAQRQLDVFGELFDTFLVARRYGIDPDDESWPMAKVLIEFLEKIWREPDEGIWEIRGEPRHFVHSKVMAWVAFDRVIKGVEEFGLDGPVAHWRAVRQEIHDDICARGWDAGRNSFVQYYGGKDLDASLLLLVQVGFLPPDDPRMHATVAAIERELMRDGLVQRYSTASAVDGLPGDEGAFLACSFWLCDAYVLCGRYDEAQILFERLIGLANDLGLLSEEYDPVAKRQLGNFPQAFSHIALINTAHSLTHAAGAAHQRADGADQAAAAAGTRTTFS
jgi:GH15 family glucan-1,4-alpha-glucosidase